MNLVKADIHIHTCLSPCADITQSPKRVVEKAYECGLNLIFITDHNSIENAEAAIRASEKYDNFWVYPGMEITTKEEIHILSLFQNIDDAAKTQNSLNSFLPGVYNEKEQNEQIIANEFDEVEGFYSKSLFSSVDLTLDNIVELIHENNGLAIPAHIDRQSFSVISQLGFVPVNCRFDALEISPNITDEKAKEIFKTENSKYKFVRGSDAHALHNIGLRYTEFYNDNDIFKSFIRFLNE